MYLHKIFKPKKEYELTRLGKKNDGGYLVGIQTVNESQFLLSFGIRDDWSFEIDFLKKNFVKSLCFDSENILDILKKKFKLDLSFFYKLNILKIIKNLITFYNFYKFKKKTKIIQKTISTGDLNRIISEINSDKIFLKIDIESSEYSILNEIIQNQERIVGLVIEFHNIQRNMDVLTNFIKKFKLEITHIHPNNYSQLDKDGNPEIIEMSFEKNPQILSDEKIFPNALDMKNWKRGPDIEINFYE
jgi:hypothetical protein